MEFKKFAAEAASALTRAVQYTEEKFGKTEKTELDAHFENLAQRSDQTKLWSEKLLARIEGVLTPNPSNRVEDFFFEKLDKKPRDRLSNLELLGVDLIEAGNEFGPGTAYGTALIKVGHTQQRLGGAEREFIQSSAHVYIHPLRKFLEGDMKTIMKERKILENRRLDLDACKNRLRKARSMEGQQNVRYLIVNVVYLYTEKLKEGVTVQDMIDQAERELRLAQSEFDRQAEITKLLLEGITSTHGHHLRCLNEFVEAQLQYYAQSHQYMMDLQRELSSATMSAAANSSAEFSPMLSTPASGQENQLSNNSGLKKKARVLYDYTATDSKQLSLQADEVITVYSVPGLGSDWIMGERGTQKGKIPVAYIEFLQ
uniref:Uncharacterized protein n=1 Tax=Strigamia maritima TaxID=126957 RepID=T1JPH5_STRMM